MTTQELDNEDFVGCAPLASEDEEDDILCGLSTKNCAQETSEKYSPKNQVRLCGVSVYSELLLD